MPAPSDRRYNHNNGLIVLSCASMTWIRFKGSSVNRSQPVMGPPRNTNRIGKYTEVVKLSAALMLICICKTVLLQQHAIMTPSYCFLVINRMSPLPVRRFQRLYEQVLLSQWLSLVVGWVVVVALPSLIYFGWDGFNRFNLGQSTALWVNSILYLATYFSLRWVVLSFPGGRSKWLVLSHTIVIFTLGILLILFLRVQVSRAVLILSGLLALCWFPLEQSIRHRYQRTKLAVLNNGFACELLNLKHLVDARLLEQLDLGEIRYDGVVADFLHINADEQRFLTQCALQGVPVYNAKDVFESVTGRVKIDRMSENNIGALLPSRTVERLKTLFDMVVVLATAPLVLFIGLITAACIRLESPGPVIYSQTRIGKGNKPFTIYKFRSMRFDREAPAQFAGEDDPRITKVGRIIRKLRIDELPQFINILKGEMSLIGPRPEQPDFEIGRAHV